MLSNLTISMSNMRVSEKFVNNDNLAVIFLIQSDAAEVY